MRWRVMVELTGKDGSVRTHEVSAGGNTTTEPSSATIGLTLADGKRTLAGLQDHLVRAQTKEYCRGRRRCPRCGSQRPLKDVRTRRLLSLFGTVEVRAPRFLPCRCAVTSRHTLSPVAEIMPDRCTPEYERLIAKMGSLLPYRRARTLLAEFLPLADVPAVETTRRRTTRVGARLERSATIQPPPPTTEARSIALSIDGGHVRSVRCYQVRSFEIFLAQVSNDDGQQVVFSSMPAEADRQREQLRGVLHGLGATPTTPITILSDGAEGPRSLGEAASLGPTRHVLDWFHLSMRIQHVAQTAKSWPDRSAGDARTGADLADAIERIRWRLWHGQVKRALDLIGETLVTLDTIAAAASSPIAGTTAKLARGLRELETYVSGQSELIIDYATARRRGEPISTATTESTVQWLLHRRMNARQQMRWSPRGAHLMLKVRTAVMNRTLERDHTAAERWAQRPFRSTA
ncbi:hypothetical protein SAMN05519104_8221 [Rhizobiales bacterium GAS188]|nr:hypothetical protein SAMN05519104_8221 [Rhizobiales bacterium GAS188]